MIEKLNSHYSMTNPASVYDEEALTALELAGRTTAKVNEVVDAQNQLTVNTNLHLNEQDVKIEHIRTVTVPEDVETEVQDQINNGTFDRQINRFAGDLQNQIDTTNDRITNLARLEEGSTTGDAEMIDARIGNDGVTYPTLGQAIRKQMNQKFGCESISVTASNYSTIMTDANDAPINKSVFIFANITSDMVANLPLYGQYGLLQTFTYDPNSEHGCVQFYYSKGGGFWRFETTSNNQDSWGYWHEFADASIIPDLYKSSNVFISSANASFPFTDCNNAPINKTFFISSNITSEHIINLPVYGKFANLFTMAYYTKSNHGLAQYYMTHKQLYYRFESGNGDNTTWSPWVLLTDNGKYCTGLSTTAEFKIDYSTLTFTLEGTGFIWSINKYMSISALLNNSVTLEYAGTGQTSIIYIRDNTMICENMLEYKPVSDDIIMAQIYHSRDTINQILFIAGKNNNDNSDVGDLTCSIFNRVCCVGDSYTSGHVTTTAGGTTTTNEKYAYPSYMEKLTGCEYVNCGHSGANVLTWLTRERGLPKAQQTGRVQAYLIGLGLNDISTGSDRYVELGTPADIGTEKQTYYAGLSKIIRELKSISPDAFIFVQTMPKTTEIAIQYNEAIRNVVNTYSSTYNTHLLDLYNYIGLYQSPSVRINESGGHYTPAGYQQCAKILCKVWSDYINDNGVKFHNVHLIPYDEV